MFALSRASPASFQLNLCGVYFVLSAISDAPLASGTALMEPPSTSGGGLATPRLKCRAVLFIESGWHSVFRQLIDGLVCPALPNSSPAVAPKGLRFFQCPQPFRRRMVSGRGVFMTVCAQRARETQRDSADEFEDPTARLCHFCFWLMPCQLYLKVGNSAGPLSG